MAFNESIFRREFTQLLRELREAKARVAELEQGTQASVDQAVAAAHAAHAAILATHQAELEELKAAYRKLRDEHIAAAKALKEAEAALRVTRRELERVKQPPAPELPQP
jgi:septation ring formation regulator EzrA